MKNFFKSLGAYFLQGLLYIAPIGLTLYILFIVFDIVNGFSSFLTNDLLGIKIPGLGLAMMLALIIFTGYFGKTVIAKPIASFISNFIARIPVINTVYSAIKDIFSAFVGKEKKFSNPVLVKTSENPEMYRIGFITQKDLSKLKLSSNMVSVYMPFSYAVMGDLVIVHVDNITELHLSSAEALKFAISGGLTEIIEKHTHNNDTEKTPADTDNK